METLEKSQIKKTFFVVIAFLLFYFMPENLGRVSTGLNEAVLMMSDYARKHILFCLVPAFFIAGAISVFIKSDSVMKYMGAAAPIVVAYAMGAVSGTILAVCSCTVLPIFVGIYMRGAGLGPAIAFLYSGPAINIIAITMTARVLGFEIGVARIIGAVSMSVIIGLIMGFLFRGEEKVRVESFVSVQNDEQPVALWRIAFLISSMVGFLISANFGHPDLKKGILYAIFSVKWYLTGFFLIATILSALLLFKKKLLAEWIKSTLDYTLQVTPLLFIGVLTAGFLLGRPGHEALIPPLWIEGLVGGNSLSANLFAAFFGALMYFATLTEVPILQGLIGTGMGNGPALALLLAGPALSLPSILVISKAIRWKKTLAFVGLVVFFSTLAGVIFGMTEVL